MPNALEITLHSIHFDRHVAKPMWGYVVALTTASSGASQLFISPRSFKIRKHKGSDLAYVWEGEGRLVFRHALEGLESVTLQLMLFRDRQKVRDFGALLQKIFGKEGEGAKVADAIAAAVTSSSPAGAIVAMTPAVGRAVGQLLSQVKDKLTINAAGLVRMDTFADDEDCERPWGFADSGPAGADALIPWGKRERGDKGYFQTDWDRVTLGDPSVGLVTPDWPALPS